MIAYLTRRERFNAAHKLWIEDWSIEKNQELFGKCCNANWHGHNYDLFVTVKGEPNPKTGFVMNVKDLSIILKDYVVEKLDHKNLNLDVDFIPKNMQPTTENLAILIWKEIEDIIRAHGAELHAIKLYETENIYAEYFGE